ncbi:hypothetical protein A3A63_01465 [Candidatus Gottesmanbacteria bacterium RIFCSPLOWO2_01_FULL_46_9]|uniref:Cache domain-containing protein n=1 Tax=Candidatus Gottesmanbacteria bacterium RIFCSPLOWO2_01_FULL_46_9 TaxID=1798394 RepID=A0A1F6AXR2_9BACT|nr:MAG: hypothetical protein A3A63_01465 [Candidatus Gottesmanbacteria bacterium RIFCSPLOWO2_01_FULL_46_9]
MKKKTQQLKSGVSVLWIIVGFSLLALLGWFGYTKLQGKPNTNEVVKTTEGEVLSPVIEAVLTQKLKLLEELAGDSVLVSETASSTKKNKALSESDIAKLDDKWKAAKDGDALIVQYLTNKVAKTLITFQEDNPGFVEIFVTDAVGLNVGQTNKTSDYLQADEDWWTGAYSKGAGKAYHGEIEYDESAQSESISLYVPVYAKDKTVVGVIKGVFNITALQKEL